MASKEEDYDYLYKIVLVGDAGVGKTNLLARYIKGTLPKTSAPTIGVEFATRTVPLASGGTIKAQIWDTAGQERYRAITSAHYRRAIGALLVYDVTKEQSFQNVKRWMEELRDNAEPDIAIMLVGNKVDLCDRNASIRRVPTQQGEQFAQTHGLLFQETSAVTTVHVKEAFEVLLQHIFNEKSKDKRPKPLNDVNSRLASRPQEPAKNSCCGI